MFDMLQATRAGVGAGLEGVGRVGAGVGVGAGAGAGGSFSSAFMESRAGRVY